jgi:hypothetical protein
MASLLMRKLKLYKMNIFKLFLFLFLFGTIDRSYSQAAETGGTDTKGKAKKETKYTEVVATDSVRATELLKRAVNWVKDDAPKYDKTNGVTTSSKAECITTFTVKPKELNPECDYTGTIVMKVVIECKDNKYRYTINGIKHISKTGQTTGGSIDNIVPECGSMVMSDLQWKKIKGEAIKCVNIAINDIKEGMIKDSKTAGDDW